MSRPAKQKRSERTRRQLLDAAREAFTRRGFAEASMEEIAQRVGVSRGPLYHYFESKQDLFAAVYEEVEEALAQILRAGLSEGALYIARAEDQAAARQEVGAAIERLLAGLRRSPR